MKAGLTVALLLVLSAVPAQAAGEPEGFTIEALVEGAAQPTAMDFLPDGRLIYAERAGDIWIVDPTAEPATTTLAGTVAGSVVDQLPVSELGLTAIAVDPDYSSNGHLYVWHSVDIYGTQRLSRMTLHDDVIVADSLTTLWETPERNDEASPFHVGGGIAFGPDGNLYFSIGDRWSWSTAQDRTHSSGAVHRIAPDGSIPADNPFNDGDGPNIDSIFSFGHRNPFRLRWDVPTRSLYVAEVGWDTWEEINVVRLEEPGHNYEWNACEGDKARGSVTSACARSFVAAFASRVPAVLERPSYWAAGAVGLAGLGVAWRKRWLSNRWLQIGVALVGTVVVWSIVTKSVNLNDHLRDYEGPIFTYQHDILGDGAGIPDTPLGASVTGGVVYRGRQFPALYEGAYFFGDFMNGWVGYLTFEDPDSPTYHPFSTGIGGVTDVQMSPDGDLYYVRLFDASDEDPENSGSILRVRYEASNSS